jgi:hypothetical protein
MLPMALSTFWPASLVWDRIRWTMRFFPSLVGQSPAAAEEANQGSDRGKKQAEHGTESYQINDWKCCCKLLILQSVRVLARDTYRTAFRKANKSAIC